MNTEIRDAIIKILQSPSMTSIVNGWLADPDWDLLIAFEDSTYLPLIKMIESCAKELWIKGLLFDTLHELNQAIYIRNLEERIKKLEELVK